MSKLMELGSAAAAMAGLATLANGGPVAASEVPPARDGNIAIKEELCAARKKGTVEAYDLFIARHPDHPLAAVARKERSEVAARARPGTD